MPIHNLSHLIPEVLIFGCGLIFVDNIFSLFSLILIKMISFIKQSSYLRILCLIVTQRPVLYREGITYFPN